MTRRRIRLLRTRTGGTTSYDGENKQVKASNPNGLLGEYWYDGDGKRVKKYVPPLGNDPGETTVFVYDAAGPPVASEML